MVRLFRIAAVIFLLLMMWSMWMLLITKEYADRNKYFISLVIGFVSFIFFLDKEKRIGK